MNGKYKALNKDSLVDRSYNQILRNITSGQLKEGDRLVIDQIAKQLGISLIPVREALARLHSDNLVTHNLNKGYRVADLPKKDDYENLFTARMIVETGAIRKGIENVKDEDVEELRSINKKIKQLSIKGTFENVYEFVDLNEIFHVKLVSFVGNPLISKMHKNLGYEAQTIRKITGQDILDLKRNATEHDKIIRAVAARDADAAIDAIESHIMKGMERFMESYMSS